MAGPQFQALALEGPVVSAFDSTFLGSGMSLSNNVITNDKATTVGDGTTSITRSTTSKNAGKWYWEQKLGGTIDGGASFGVCNSSQSKDPANFTGSDANAWALFNGGSWFTGNSGTVYTAYVTGDVLNFAIDLSAGKIWVGKNGTWMNSGNPDAGTGNLATAPSSGSSVYIFSAPAGTSSVTGSAILYSGIGAFNNTPANVTTFVKGWYN